MKVFGVKFGMTNDLLNVFNITIVHRRIFTKLDYFKSEIKAKYFK